MPKPARKSLLERAADEALRSAGEPMGFVAKPEVAPAGGGGKRVARLPGGGSVALFGVSENPALVKEAERKAYELDKQKREDERRAAEEGSFRLTHDEAAELGWTDGVELKRADIAWVANMLQVECGRGDAPSGIAWGLLAWARKEQDKFFSTVFSKLVPKEDESEGRKRVRESHRSQVELFDQVGQWLRESESPKGEAV